MLQKLRPHRVGILIASLQVGGAERAALGLLEGLLASGVDAHLLTLDRNRDMTAVMDDAQRQRLARRIVHLTHADVGWSTVTKTLAGPWQWWRLRKAVRDLRLDLVISIVERANIVNLIRAGGGRRVISIRSYPSHLLASKTALKRGLVVWLYRAFLRRADRIVFVSHETAADFERLFPVAAGRGAVIHNACDLERVRDLAGEPIPDAFESVFERPVVIACGRMKAEKGHWALLRAFAEICRTDDQVRLVLLGKGPLQESLERLRDELGLHDRVFFPGFQANPLAWISRARVYVLPSHWEGFPNSLLEALAVGVPVVSTDCRSGPRELMAPESDPVSKTKTIDRTPVGFLVPPPDGLHRPASEPLSKPESLLARAIEGALRDEVFRRGQERAARERAAAFAPDRILPRWVKLIEELAGSSHSAPTRLGGGRGLSR